MSEWPIARRLTAILLGISGLVLLLTSAAFVGYQFWSFRSSARESLAVKGRIIAGNTTASLAFANPADAQQTLSALRADPHIVAAVLFDRDGRMFAAYPTQPAQGLVPEGPGADGYHFENGLLVGYQPVAQTADQRLGTLYLASDLDELYGTLRLSGAVALGVSALALLAAYALSGVLHKTVTEPILGLAETASAVSNRRDYSVRAPALGGGELGGLTEAFNHMLGHIEGQDLALKASKEELEGYAAELEKRVAARTQELETSNEALSRNAADLLVANRELDAFAYSVSHDLRAPLRSIDGFSHVLLEDYGPTLDESGRDYLSRVRAASQRMGALIDDLLMLSRISRVPMRPESVDLSELATTIVADLQAEAPEREVEFEIAEGLRARGDRRLLQVALDNLIRNSWKYTAKQPHPRIELASSQEDGERVYRVRDNGAGFDMMYADKLFGEFQRLHTQAEFEGTGVGLATVRRIISRHGGRIWAEGVVDEGATFYFTL